MRLQKYIALCGVASRRKAELLISDGRITVNDKVVTEMGTKVTESDDVAYDGTIILPEENKLYILFNKPEGVITTVSDEFGRVTVLDYFTDIKERIYPVGRLDYDTSGLLILTNDGAFANYMTHPSNHVGKTYLISCNPLPDISQLEQLRSGVVIEGYKTQKAKVEEFKSHGKWNAKMTIYEGRNRQIRKMFDTIGCRVNALRRTGIGGVHDSRLPEGEHRELTIKELRDLGYEFD